MKIKSHEIFGGMLMIVICLSIAPVLAVDAVEATSDNDKVTQREVEAVVNSKIVVCIHNEDALTIQQWLKSRGATNEMLAQAYYSVMNKTKDAPLSSLEGQKFKAAVYGYSGVATDTQLTNLLTVASSTTNVVSTSDCIYAYHTKAPTSKFLLHWCINRVNGEDCDLGIKSTIWTCFERTLRLPRIGIDVKEEILKCAYKSLELDGVSVFAADRILVKYDPRYSTSSTRKNAFKRVQEMTNDQIPAFVRRYVDGKSKELGLK